MLKLIYALGHVVNSRCYGRCYVKKKLVPLCTFLKFHTNPRVNSAGLFQNDFNKCSRALTLAFSKKRTFSWLLPYYEVHTTSLLSDNVSCRVLIGVDELPSIDTEGGRRGRGGGESPTYSRRISSRLSSSYLKKRTFFITGWHCCFNEC